MKKVLFLLIALMSVMCLNAQELRMPKYKFTDNWSISVGAGTNATFGDNYKSVDTKRIFGPTVNVSLNKYWTPVLGTRIQGEWGQNHVVPTNEISVINRYGFYLDAMLNPLNLFSQNYDRPVNLVLIGGVGYAHTFDNGVLPIGDYVVPRVGVQVNVDLSKSIQLNIEGNMSALNDKFDGVVGGARYDGMCNLTAGITYKFKNHDGTRGFTYIPSYDQEDIDALNEEINKLRQECEKAPKVVTTIDTVTVENIVVLKEVAPTTVRFTINSSKIADDQMANLENIATYLKDNKDVRISITGYADADTGTPEYNMELSKKRAESVKEVLVKYGVEESRLVVSAEGDKVQQYEENSWNRATIMMSIPQD